MLLAFDDTDSREGGCTTHLAGEILARIGHPHARGPPRLVRLDPDNPWKTRGNAAVVLDLEDDLDPERVLERGHTVIEQRARVGEGKGAGIAVFEHPPDPSWYERGVREPVPVNEARAALSNVPTATLGNGRGLVGALCAAAWRPGEQATWTRITYRDPHRWGTPRNVDRASIEALADRFPETFDCRDPRDGHPAMVPRTPCPVLYGLRATHPGHLEAAQATIESEPVARATTFVTNQATDDHIHPDNLEPVHALDTPRVLGGGHVTLDARTRDGRAITCMAFEPTGRLRDALRAVKPGDALLPVGSHRGDQINLEKLLHAPEPTRARQPCPGCGRAMSSTGREGPVRCRRCGHRAPKRYNEPAPRWTEADVSARRHLARPLALGLAPHVEEAARELLEPEDEIEAA